MSKESNLDKIKNLPEFTKQFGGLVIIILIVISSFFVLNIMFGGGDELVRKMKLEEERIAQEKKLSELISKLPSGILVTFDGTCLLYTSPSPRDYAASRMPSSA